MPLNDKTLLIIPCCKRKISGGDPLPENYVDVLSTLVSEGVYHGVMQVRERMFGRLENRDQYMPAIDRYIGGLYTAFNGLPACIGRNTNSNGQPKLLILSALYGPLHPDSLINEYDLPMPNKKQSEWYKFFPSFLADFVRQQSIETIRVYCSWTTGYYKVLSNAVQQSKCHNAIFYEVKNGDSNNTPKNLGLQLATDLCCGEVPDFTKKVVPHNREYEHRMA